MPLDALAFGAHPDDVELACSGTLIKLASQGYETGVIALTRGELSTRGSLEIRADEFDRAAKAMRVSAHKILDIPDGFIESSRSQKLKVIREIRTHRPRIVLAPYWADRHPDHANASVLVREAAFLAGLERIETNQDAFRPYRVVFYPCRYEFKPSFIVDISGFHDQKLRAIQAYESQFDHPEKNRFGDQETNISRPEFLEAVITRSKQYGSYIGTAFGEPFLVREPLRLDDPVEFFDSTYGGSLL
jgi:bacillithiol biosynthesis deacetylase BshB1